MPVFNASAAGGQLNGSNQNDTLNGGSVADQLHGLDGNDTLNGGNGNDTLFGGNGNDQLFGGSGNDDLFGDAGDDLLVGNDGNDVLEGGDGNDTLTGSAGNDKLYGGNGVDTADYSASTPAVNVNLTTGDGSGGDAHGDKLYSIENLVGSAFDDTLTGSSLDNLLIGGAGADIINGAGGVDTVSYSTSGSGVTVNLTTGVGSGGDAQGDTLTAVENIVGSAYNDVLTGGTGVNVVYGGAGNDTITGGNDNDTMYGGDGDDLFLVEWSVTGDSYDGGAGTDTFSADVAGLNAYAQEIDLVTGVNNWQDRFVSIENLIGSAVNDKFWGTEGVNVFHGRNGNDLLDGRGGNDALYGEAGNDTLVGGAGDDLLNGGTGADAITGGDGVDTATYAESSAAVTVNLTTGIGSGGDAAGDTLATVEDLVGSAFNDVLTGNAGINVLDGGAGDDVLAGGAGADRLVGGGGSDTADYSSASAGVTVNLVTGSASDGDVLVSIENATGSSFNDVLVSAAGANLLNGAAGVDTVDYSAAATGITVNLVTGSASDGDVLVAIENVVGSSFNDVLVSAAGANLLNGAAGVDTVDYSAAAAGITVNLVTGSASDGDVLVSIENAMGSAFNDSFVSGTAVNSFNGGAGNDLVDYTASNSGVTVNLESGNGQGGDAEGDRFISIENTLGSLYADVLIGNASGNRLEGNQGNDTLHGLDGDDVIYGGSGDDRIYGGVGADNINGGDGTDTADYRYSTAAVNVSLVTNTGTGGDAQGDVLSLIENLAGSNFDDVLTGNDGVNRLVGNQGSDTLYGMGGNDVFDTGGGYDIVYGGAGIDTVTYDDSWGLVVVNLATGTGSGAEAANDLYFGVENVTGSLFDDRLTGDAGVNQLTGLDGNDYLDGGAGNDYLVGGLGGDTLIGGAGDQDVADYDDATAGVVVNLVTGGTGGEAAGDTYSGVEYVYGSDFNDQITGDGAINRLLGNAGDDMLDGGAGNDILIGGAGADTLVGGAGDQDAASYQLASAGVIVNLFSGGTGGEAAGDTYTGIEYVYGSEFGDQITGDALVNRLTGGGGNDWLDGGGGNDYLLGDAGNDTLTGGAGADVYIFGAGLGNDTITDFWAGVGRTDRVWLQGTGLNTYADVLANAVNTAAGVVITAAGQGTLTLAGLSLAQLNADDFLFG